ncbi:hypothetical protein Hanom_Chr04g00318991 [Helianthus anomalus]
MVNLADSMLWVSLRVNNLIICISNVWEFILQAMLSHLQENLKRVGRPGNDLDNTEMIL